MGKRKSKLSRRQFIQGMGTGLVGSTVLLHSLKVAAMAKEDVQANGPRVPLHLRVNGREVKLSIEPRTTLAELLREHLQLTGTKISCNRGECGACTVLLDGKPVYSCQMLALDAQGREVTTIEGLLDGEELHPLQKAFLEHDGLQCGFCTPGQIMAARGLLLKNPHPTREEVIKGMSGNLCRCGAYPNIIKSVMAAAEKLAGKKAS